MGESSDPAKDTARVVRRHNRRVALALRILIVSLALAAAVLPAPSPAVVERWFSVSFYPILQRTATPLSNAVPFAILDALTLVLLAGLVAAIVLVVKRTRRTRSAKPVLRLIGQLAATAAAIYLVFLLMWGLNYRRLPMWERLEADSRPPSTDAVMALGRTAVERLNTLHAPSHRTGWRTEPWMNPRLLAAFETVQGYVGDGRGAVPGRLKDSLYGVYFRWSGVDGMINPFGLEVLANPDLLPFERPFVAAHEWAHLAGFADEAEASFVGWLTCVHADDGSAYSAWLSVFWQLRADVSAGDRAALARTLAAGPAEDIAAIEARVRRGEQPRVREASRIAYDRYLKANRVEEGIRSYGGVLRLITGTRFTGEWVPVRRLTSGSSRRGEGGPAAQGRGRYP
jgi:hypothetical protein